MGDVTTPELEGIPREGFQGRNGEPIENVKLISTGGVYGDVFSCRYPGEQQSSVAIKVLKRGQNTEPNRQLFRDEVKTLNDLTSAGSTHTPQVHKFHDDPSGLSSSYFVMDLAKGISLDNLAFETGFVTYEGSIDAGFIHHFDQQTALEITTQLLETLKNADQAGFSYLDWKSFGGSLYWDMDRKRLTIIDWGGLTDRQTEETRQRSILQSLRLLYNLVTGEELVSRRGPGVNERGEPEKQ